MRTLLISTAIFIWIILAVGLRPEVLAQSRGIGVSPSKIILDSKTIFPVSIDVFVKNLSDRDEWISFSFSKNLLPFVVSEEGRFALGKGETARTKIILDNLESLRGEGVIKISATGVSSAGLSTGTGLKIPVVWAGGRVLGAENSPNFTGFMDILKNLFSGLTFKILLLILAIAILWKLSKFLAKNFSAETI